MGVERLVEEHLEVRLTPERPDGPQALQRDDDVREDCTASYRGHESRKKKKKKKVLLLFVTTISKLRANLAKTLNSRGVRAQSQQRMS